MAQVLVPWGYTAQYTGSAWKDDSSNTSEEQLNALGMHHDGMHFFPLNDQQRRRLIVY